LVTLLIRGENSFYLTANKREKENANIREFVIKEISGNLFYN